VLTVLRGSANPSGSPDLIAGQGATAPPARGLPAPAGATYAILNPGDIVLVQGSNVLCRFERGQVKLVCMLTNGNGPLSHSWGTSMNIEGAVRVFQFDADGKPTTAKKFRRLLEGVAAPAKIYRLKVGDRYRVSSTRIACRVRHGNSSFGGTPVAHCYYITPKVIKATREFVINNFFAGVFSVQLRLNGAGTILDVKKLETLYAQKQPRLAR
jgi:hypothetical protein